MNVNPTRNSVEEIYAAIVKDLKEAVNELSEIPTDGNYARVTKKTAYGILARAYAQGAGEGLKEDGKSYWELAKATAETVITGSAGEQNFGAYLYSDVSDLWAQANNRGNKEALFIASGANGELSDQSGYAKNNLLLTASANRLTAMTCTRQKTMQTTILVAQTTVHSHLQSTALTCSMQIGTNVTRTPS